MYFLFLTKVLLSEYFDKMILEVRNEIILEKFSLLITLFTFTYFNYFFNFSHHSSEYSKRTD